MTRPIAHVDVPLPVLALQVAAAHTKSPSDRLAYALDEWLLGHPEAPVSVDADYAEWAARLATLPTYRRTKEAS
ncbi:hypothetical protein [Streptomyces canus]|uniref:hypothetical protein n=1 Tax=Streptomyces canus TaxID=58343 RepID=UPI00278484CB|nr:hypothetical protein [Streptomyces canus]MDQ0758770.1 hypothetical protein [Streptomyces canus]